MLAEFAGFTSIQGSTSLLRKTVPDWPATSSAVQSEKGLVPETWTSGVAVNGPAIAGAVPASMTTRPATNATDLRLGMVLALPVSLPALRQLGTDQQALQESIQRRKTAGVRIRRCLPGSSGGGARADDARYERDLVSLVAAALDTTGSSG